jgi:hypothetical protein
MPEASVRHDYNWAGRLRARCVPGAGGGEQQMTKSQTEILEMLAQLIDEYSDLQRSRPDLPQGSFCDLSQDGLDDLVHTGMKMQLSIKL